jgi:hypothetical protein
MNFFDLSEVATHVFYVDGSIIDYINPQTEKSAIMGNTLEEIQQRYPGAQRMEKQAAYIAYDEAMRTKYVKSPIVISAEEFDNALNVLPPMNWVRKVGTESFKISEFLTGNITSIYARIGDTFYGLADDANLTHDQIIDKCKAIM